MCEDPTRSSSGFSDRVAGVDVQSDMIVIVIEDREPGRVSDYFSASPERLHAVYQENEALGRIIADRMIALGKTAHISDRQIVFSRARKEFQMVKSVSHLKKPRKSCRPIRLLLARPGRNQLCPCGSGKKHKFCCLNKTIARG